MKIINRIRSVMKTPMNVLLFTTFLPVPEPGEDLRLDILCSRGLLLLDQNLGAEKRSLWGKTPFSLS